ncbi:MAG TPA: hypothetical protein DCQ93_10130 [Bacteroidetes bacterium]|nr:hypothetical protein [Bacteroidota bacterium]
MKNFLQKLFLASAALFFTAQNLKAQNSDCPTALFLCNENTLNVPGGAYSGGSIPEQPSCWFVNDNYSHWYSFTCTQSGTFTFSCLPVPFADFDFALYNITGSPSGSCSYSNMMSCNYAAPAGNGTTGIGCFNGTNCNTTVNLVAGQTYAIVINRYSIGSTSGFQLSFGGTAQIGIIAGFTFVSACLGQPVQFTNTSSTGTGVTYNWDFGDGTNSSAQNPSHLYSNAGTFNVSLITSNGTCSDTVTQQVTITPGPAVTVNPNPASLCAGQTVNLTASGATTYTWSPNYFLSSTNTASVTASPQTTTTYTVTGTTAGCNGTATVIVTVNSVSTVQSFPASSSFCSGGSVVLSAIGAVTYAWSPSTGLSASTGNSVTASPTVTTTYILTGTNASGCNGYDTTVITVFPIPNLIINPPAPDICIGGNILLTASGATNYSWSPNNSLSSSTGPSVTASPNASVTYTVDASDANGCTATTSVVVNVNPLPSVSINPSPATICSGDNVLLTASGATTFDWSPNSGLNSSTGSTVTASPNATTTYTVTGTSGVGCSATNTVTVNVNPLPVINILPINSVICSGGQVNLAASGALTYTWSPATGLSSTNSGGTTASPNTTTTYTVTGTSALNCSATATTIITVNPIPVIQVNPASTSICLGGSAQLSASGAISYSWNPFTSLNNGNINNPMASPNANTTYTVVGTDANGCSASATTAVAVNIPPVVSVNPSSALFCGGQNVVLTASGAANYIWSPATGLNATTGASVTTTPSSSIQYTVTGTDVNGCSGQGQANVNFDPTPVASFNVIPQSGCEPLLVTFQNTSSNGVITNWIFGDGTFSPGNPVQHLYTSGTFDVTMITTNASGCGDTAVQLAAVTALVAPVASFDMTPPAPGNLPYTDNLFTFINTSVGGNSYFWNFGDQTGDTVTNPTHSFKESGSYYVILTVTAGNGCLDTAMSPIILIEGEPKPWIPSAFTPNGDEQNDIFKVYGIAIDEIDFRVYDRWGEMVFQTNNQNQGWDGTFLGKRSELGVYVYEARIVMASGKKILLRGDVTLMR